MLKYIYMKEKENLINIYSICLGKLAKKSQLFRFCVVDEDKRLVNFIDNLSTNYKLEDVIFPARPFLTQDPFFISIMNKYGTSELSLEQLLQAERTFLNIQKIRNTQKSQTLGR